MTTAMITSSPPRLGDSARWWPQRCTRREADTNLAGATEASVSWINPTARDYRETFASATARGPRPERTKNHEVHRASARIRPHRLAHDPEQPRRQRADALARRSRTCGASFRPRRCVASRTSAVRTPNGAYAPTLPAAEPSRSATTPTHCQGSGHHPVDFTRTRSPPRMSTPEMDKRRRIDVSPGASLHGRPICNRWANGTTALRAA